MRELPVVGSSIALLHDSLGFLDRVTAAHGDVVRFHMLAGQEVYLFNHPDAIEEVLVTHRDRLMKDNLTRELTLLLGNGLLVSEGEFWRRQRRLAQPAFHQKRVVAYADTMVALAEEATGSWRDGETRDVHADMMRLTLDIVARTLFGTSVAADRERIGAALEVLLARFSGIGILVPPSIPTPGNLRARRAIAELDDVVYRLIAEARKAGDNGDLLSMLIAATTEDGVARMDDKQLRDEALTLLLAGHETTALTLGYVLDLLAQHPAVALALEEEIATVLGDRAATAADLPRLPYADAVVREAMRLYPPAWALGRETLEPIEVAGHRVGKGTQLWVAQWTVHRDARWFPEPLAFRPERWTDAFKKSLPKFAYFPFGGGPRICIGNAFAQMEAVLLLVTIARRFRVARTTGRPLHVIPSVTLRPKHGVPLVVKRRG